MPEPRRYDRSGNLSYQHTTAGNQAWGYTQVTHPGGGKSNVLLSAVDSNSIQWTFGFNSDLARRLEARAGQAYARYWYDALGRTSGVTKLGGTMTFGPNRCQYDPDGQAADPCENSSPRLVFQGPNVVGTVSVSGTDWRFIHGPGTDDPVIGLYRAPAAPAVEFYWVTDGGGRQLAVATPDGSINGTQINQLQVSGGTYAGGISNSYGFGASRFGSADIPTMSFFRNRVYDQESGRFTQEDPNGVGGGLNLYQYAGNNPATFSDPFGLTACDPIDDPDCKQVDWAGAAKQWLGDRLDDALRLTVEAGKALAKEAAIQLGLFAVTGGAGNEARAIQITGRALHHIKQAHTVEGTLTAGKSVFGAGEDLVQLARAAEAMDPVRQAGGNYQRVVNAGRIIGIDRATGATTNIYTVITGRGNRLITMFPGVP